MNLNNYKEFSSSCLLLLPVRSFTLIVVLIVFPLREMMTFLIQNQGIQRRGRHYRSLKLIQGIKNTMKLISKFCNYKKTVNAK